MELPSQDTLTSRTRYVGSILGRASVLSGRKTCVYWGLLGCRQGRTALRSHGWESRALLRPEHNRPPTKRFQQRRDPTPHSSVSLVAGGQTQHQPGPGSDQRRVDGLAGDRLSDWVHRKLKARGDEVRKILILTQAEVEELLPVRECIPIMKEALADLARGKVHQPLRMVITPPGAVGDMALMPSYRSGERAAYGVKTVCFFPGNPAKGLDSHQ